MESKRFGSSVLVVCLVFLLVASQEVQAHQSDQLAFMDLFSGKIKESDLAFMDLFGGNINVCLAMSRREAKMSKAEAQKFCTFLFLTAEGVKLDAQLSKSKSRKVKN